MHTCAERNEDVRILELNGNRFRQIAEANTWPRYTDGAQILELFTYIQEEMIRRASIKKKYQEDGWTDEALFDAATENRRINLFVANMQTLVDELHTPESPAFHAQALFDTLCERGKGYNIFVYAEVNDRDQDELMGYACMDSAQAAQSGIRFGGKFSAQKLFPFENVPYQEQERSMKPGVGVLPSDNSEARLVRVVVPLA